ncbi:monodechloroaminopyrrolnitrin synthase PrnB family protein [Fulvivirga ligni]|uniref:monodechloroaminopyrrolnitrin synthase PrnB family protein n=1 Tax=Fulvivirga ligni TaxID=2904246 RepID=UPI001F39D9E9|nr:monodechloroaminopyrrolnitrin synthase PrnB family protein [Fulvivirga ligni]UII22840.1 DUF1864 family protein [Fulvivirga ligni]
MQRTLNKSFFWEKKLFVQRSQDLAIADLDPLNMDEFFKLLPEYNQQGDVDKLVSGLYKYIPYPDKLAKFSYEESIAAMRDIGILLGSIKKHGLEPVEQVPELDYILDVLSEKTDLPPRDTLLHYSVWNPAGDRMRTYTHYTDERGLIDSVKMSMEPVVKGIHYLIELHHTDIDSKEFALICHMADACFKKMVEAIVHARRNVDTTVFSKVLRFYYDPIQLYGRDYLGPGAVEMPVFIYDHLLWGSDCGDEEYDIFQNTYLPYILPQLRDVYYNYKGQESLASKVMSKLISKEVSVNVKESAEALRNMFMTLSSFRMPHKHMAEEAYQKQDDRSTGSGGYSTGILGAIIQLMSRKRQELEATMRLSGFLNNKNSAKRKMTGS